MGGVDRAVHFLQEVLAQGPVAVDAVVELALERGISRKDLRAARRRLNVVSGSITTWALPAEKGD